jgi:acetate kinase
MMQTPTPNSTASGTQLPRQESLILTINGGSSSIKFALYLANAPLKRVFGGQLERIGMPGTLLSYSSDISPNSDKHAVSASTFTAGIDAVVSCLRHRIGAATILAIGHRIVKGGVHLVDNQLITPEVIAELRRVQPLDLDHLPREIALIDSFGKALPGVPQIACFDTAFHKDMPRIGQILPIPRRFLDAGVRRFGFHGLSYTYLMSQLAIVAGNEAAAGRVILAHLGSGASMAAVKNGKPIDTTMAFTPTSGLVMGTRPGDVDPGLLLYLMNEQHFSTDQMEHFIAHQCGMLGVSETSSDLRDLLAARAADSRAAEAVELFCYEGRKHLCELASTLGGIDTLVFSGGIGEQSPDARAGICQGLEFMGLTLDKTRNVTSCEIISSVESGTTVRIMATDEEIVIARIALSLSTASAGPKRATQVC